MRSWYQRRYDEALRNPESRQFDSQSYDPRLNKPWRNPSAGIADPSHKRPDRTTKYQGRRVNCTMERSCGVRFITFIANPEEIYDHTLRSIACHVLLQENGILCSSAITFPNILVSDWSVSTTLISQLQLTSRHSQRQFQGTMASTAPVASTSDTTGVSSSAAKLVLTDAENNILEFVTSQAKVINNRRLWICWTEFGRIVLLYRLPPPHKITSLSLFLPGNSV